MHAELYLNACWSAALIEAGWVARRLGHAQMARPWMGEGTLVRNIIERRFWNRRKRFYNFGLMKSGKFRTERTVMAGAAGALIPLRARRRIAVAEEVLQSGSQHRGAYACQLVEPDLRSGGIPLRKHLAALYGMGLASGRTAAGLPGLGFRHLMRNIRLFQSSLRRRIVPEVLHGERCRRFPSGCDSRGHSGVVSGDGRSAPFSLECSQLTQWAYGVLRISPSLPAEWQFLLVGGMRQRGKR